ncbi:MAG: hypothetical protein J2P57_01425 [Acidimicrobiaceae bacterium]|nr:hypothetical protein [Acidimicrobiaceae bacterium]
MAEESPDKGGLTAGSGEDDAGVQPAAVGEGAEPGATPAKPTRARSTAKKATKPAAGKSTASRRGGNADKAAAPRAKPAGTRTAAKTPRRTAAAGQTASGTRAVARASVSRAKPPPAVPESQPAENIAAEPGVPEEPQNVPVEGEAPEDAAELDTGDAADLEVELDMDAPAEPKRGLPGRARRWVASQVLATCLAAALVVAVVLLIVTWLQLGDRNSLNHARSSALSAAKTYAVEIGSYNYQTLSKDFGKVMSDATPSFRQSYSKSSDSLKSLLGKYHASAKATVVSAGLVSASTSRAVALVALNQTETNTNQKGKSTSQTRLEMTLLHSGGRWLINNVSIL